ncbi:Uncharacterized protein APZ42_028224 [Daphnia magna]|uniref:Uncharacterized protein n=1 Tax=Daphnia magna TaxID=35525 RepID=A0A164QL03_9CRUS|nr:Uncharacterized protein APZ42_028224 [Daphnia magna]
MEAAVSKIGYSSGSFRPSFCLFSTSTCLKHQNSGVLNFSFSRDKKNNSGIFKRCLW